MAKNNENELYWNSKIKIQIKEEYNQFLKDEGLDENPDSAHVFAITKIAGGHKYHGKSERDLIQLLSDKLPFMYN